VSQGDVKASSKAGGPCKVLITNAPPAEHYAPLRDVAEVMLGPEGGTLMPRQQVLEHADQLYGIINQAELTVDAELLDAAPRLKVIANVAIGTNNFDLPLMRRRGVVGTNVPDAFVDATADATFALMLAVARRIATADRYVRSGRWPDDGFQPGVWDGMELRGKTLGIVGFGKIGQAVAERAAAFGMEVLFHTRRDTDDPRARSLNDLLAAADVVSLHVPLTEQTHHLLDAGAMGRMKHGALLINMARGPVVDEAALIEALRSGHLAGAGLDVFEDEPRVHPALLDMEQAVLTPHLGGGTRESRRRARRACATDVARVLRGETPWHAVT